MPYLHLIRCLTDGRTEWLSCSREGSVLQGPQTGWPSAAAERVVLLLPAEDVLLLRAPRVAKHAAQLAQALPFAIEESLAAPVEQQQVAFAADVRGDSVPVAVVARDLLQARLAELAAAGLAADAVYSELQCLPGSAGGSTLWFDQQRLLIRSAADTGVVLATNDQAAMSAWLQREQLLNASSQRWCSPGNEQAGAEPLPQPPLVWLSAHLPGADQPNLLQGDFAPQRRVDAARRQWRWAAALALFALLAGTAQLWLERVALQRHVEARQAEMERVLRDALPGLQRVVDPVAQLRAALGGQARNADALALLGRIAPILQGGSQMTLEGIEYRAGSMELVVMGADVASLDLLRERLASLALKVELTSAVPGSRGVEGRLRLSGAGA